jgi:hypothetical protein
MAESGDLFSPLRKQGLRRKAARAVAEAYGGKRPTAAAREVLADLEAAGEAIRRHVTTPDARRRAAKTAAATRKGKAQARSEAARRAARKRKAASR